MKHEKSIFIFRRDLRLIDNTGLNNALKQSKIVIPIFIFDPRQIGKANKYASENAIQFMCESLAYLESALLKNKNKLYIFYGKPEEIIEKLIKSEMVDAIFVNRDYTPFSIKRDDAIAKICKKHNIIFNQSDDILLHAPENITKKDKSYYSVFTAFYKKALTLPVRETEKLHRGIFFSKNIKIAQSKRFLKKITSTSENENIACHGGSNKALAILRNIADFKDYKNTHDYPSIKTSHLSAHLKFGTISIRQTYDAIVTHLGKMHPLLRQLYWRDFFTHIAFHQPTIFGHAYHKKYDKLLWNYNKNLFKIWCEGKTGFPIVDAGMKELNTTGFMHNRIRMIVASFLVKDLHIDWLWGEQYFAQKLVDYDPAINNGNWQWAASTGCDAQPYFRIFNPWLQQKKYDPECEYIKQWIPELQSCDNKIIHNWFKESSPIIQNYPRPILDHAKESIVAKKMYKKIKPQ